MSRNEEFWAIPKQMSQEEVDGREPTQRAILTLDYRLLFFVIVLAIVSLNPASSSAQVDTINAPSTPAVWVGGAHVEGHLALTYSSDGAFSPDGSLLAVVADEKILVLNLQGDATPKVLKPRFPDVHDLEIHSANFISPREVFVLANGVFHTKGKPPSSTPLMAFRWNVDSDQVSGKLSAVGVKGGYSPARFFPAIGYLVLYKEGKFELWKPQSDQGGVVEIPDLTQIPNIYEFSPDGHWLLLAQIQTTGGADPSVVQLKTHKFVDELHGHGGTVLSMAFSHDANNVVTACEDGKLRVFSTGDWKLRQTLSGHHGPVHRAEFSANGKWIVSAGEDHTVRVWSAEDGTLLQTLEEPNEPVLDVAFSPDARFIAASTDKQVFTWKRQGGD